MLDVTERALCNAHITIPRRSKMPPKPKYTKEEITAAALAVVSRGGMDALTAKELGRELSTSASPIFTVFNSMQEVQDAVKLAAMQRFESYAHEPCDGMPLFKHVGMQMIRFAKEEPQLYRLIFMSQNSGARSFSDIYSHLGPLADDCLAALCREYELSPSAARMLFEHTWIFTFGIGALCAGGVCDLSSDEISAMLTRDFSAMLAITKKEDLH